MKIGRHCHDVALLLASFDGEEGSDAKTKPHNNKLAPGDDLGASSCMDHDVSHGEHRPAIVPSPRPRPTKQMTTPTTAPSPPSTPRKT